MTELAIALTIAAVWSGLAFGVWLGRREGRHEREYLRSLLRDTDALNDAYAKDLAELRSERDALAAAERGRRGGRYR